MGSTCCAQQSPPAESGGAFLSIDRSDAKWSPLGTDVAEYRFADAALHCYGPAAGCKTEVVMEGPGPAMHPVDFSAVAMKVGLEEDFLPAWNDREFVSGLQTQTRTMDLGLEIVPFR
mmetsp:Transcript_9933/g.21216  ORF Transcript_9933/g.21216 Transcript_9933/m.21216 type:complete len:117 (-) Transcript_9933:206-556(-)